MAPTAGADAHVDERLDAGVLQQADELLGRMGAVADGEEDSVDAPILP
jgi:hypothetical protein